MIYCHLESEDCLGVSYLPTDTIQAVRVKLVMTIITNFINIFMLHLQLYAILTLQPREILHQHPVDEDVTAAHFASLTILQI